MKKWIKGLIIGIAVIYTIAMFTIRFTSFAVPGFMWLGMCLIGHGAFIFLLMGLFTRTGSCGKDCNSRNSSTPLDNQN